MKRERSGDCKAAVSKLVNEVFGERPSWELELFKKEIAKKYVPLVQQTPQFTQGVEQKRRQKRSQKIREGLGSQAWRWRSLFDNPRSMTVERGDAEAVHEAWRQYAQTVIASNPAGMTLDTLRELDWHGAGVTVKRARNPRSVGVEGIVFAMTELEVWIINDAGRKVRVDKDGTVFDMSFGDRAIEVKGTVCFDKDIQVGKKCLRKQTRKQNARRKLKTSEGSSQKETVNKASME